MELRDLIVTPIVLLLVYVIAYYIRPLVTDIHTKKYFLPTLTVKIVGAITLGFIYKFYYSGGDTFFYHTYGSRLVWETILESPIDGISLLFRKTGNYTGIYNYASRVYFFRDPQSYMIVRISTLFDLLTYSTYSATAILFAVFSLIGTWSLYLVFYSQYPHLHKNLALAICFIPSVFFWGSGILKDTIVLACLGIATYQIYELFIKKKFRVRYLVLLLLMLYLIFSIKKFILQVYIPSSIIWVIIPYFKKIQSPVIKFLLFPLLFILLAYSAYFSAMKIGEGDERYSVEKLAKTAKITAYDIRYWSGKKAGSGYDLGKLDGTFISMIQLMPQAINVTLFRPYLWEVKNPLMLLSSLEGTFFFILVVNIIVRKRTRILNAYSNPNIIFSLLFSLSCAFAVGVSTFNFGTLARYKIPLLPFFTTSLVILTGYENRSKKLDVLEKTE